MCIFLLLKSLGQCSFEKKSSPHLPIYFSVWACRWLRCSRIRLQCRRPRFDPWVGEDPLKKEMAIHSSILAWRSPWAEESDGLQFMGGKESDRTKRLILSLSCGRVLPRLWFIIYGHKDDLKSAIKASILGEYHPAPKH